MTHTQWISEDYMWMELYTEDEYKTYFDSITSWLEYYDANSLYPSQMIDKPIACGQMYYNNVDLRTSDFIINSMEKEAALDKPDVWSAALIKVNVTCPTDLLIPFLMRRDDKGRNEQNLLPIKELWYAGPELLEAIRLGYKITRVYAYYRFDKFEVLYKEFITYCYNQRKANPTGALNIMPKFCMNSASGKGAQHIIYESQSILIGDKEMYGERKATSTECKVIFTDNHCDEALACFLKETKSVTMTPFCLNATVWILAWSRVAMSKFTRLIDGYRSVTNCPIYGDTDSLFITNTTAATCPPGTFGKELGMFKNEMPTSKILRMMILAPKTYMKVFLGPKHLRDGKCGDYYEKDGTLREIPRLSYLAHPQGRRIKDCKRQPIEVKDEYEKMLQVTCKGIPHYSKPYRAQEEYLVSPLKQQEILDIAIKLNSRKETLDATAFKQVALKDRYHVFEEPGQPPRVYAAFTEETFFKVSQGKGSFTTVFGMMDRNLQQTNMEKMGIILDYNHRKLVAEPYWEKGKRIKNEDFITYPLGYQ